MPGGIFRNRAVAPAPDQHQQTPDEGGAPQSATRPTGPVGLPRRRKPGVPTLVSDHGRRVDVPAPPRTGPAAPGPGGLPRRVRQANLAPQLRGTPASDAEPAVVDDEERDADEVRSRMASLQRGWQRGRRENSAQDSAESAAAGSTGPAGTARGTTSEGTGR